MAKDKKSKALTIISIVVAVILALVIAGGAYCISTKQNPVEAVKTVFTSNDEELIGKWQSQKNPGLSAYVFYDDGTYDSYISTANFKGSYIVDGNKLRLVNPSTSKEIIFKFRVTEKELTLTLIEEDGKKPEQSDISKYDRVDELNQKSIVDLIGELKQDTTEADKD